MTQVELSFLSETNLKRADVNFFSSILTGVNQKFSDFIDIMELHSNRPIQTITPIERNVLLIGTFELSERIDIPYRVVISEAVSLSQKFGTGDGCRFVNGVLDKIAISLRSREISADKIDD
tara:strand:- start:229 stop:591 length:363 start_codon:yes stop_codon:yes gene_type:complete